MISRRITLRSEGSVPTNTPNVCGPRSVDSSGRRSLIRVLQEDPPDLCNDGRSLLAQVARRHEQLGRRPVNVCAVIRDDPVAAPGRGRVAPVRDDRMNFDRRRQSQIVQAHEDRRVPLKFVDAGGQALPEEFREEVRTIASDQPPVGRSEWIGQANEPRRGASSGPGRADYRDAAWR